VTRSWDIIQRDRQEDSTFSYNRTLTTSSGGTLSGSGSRDGTATGVYTTMDGAN
jgi:hypothetical protein